MSEEKATTIANIETEEGPVELLDDDKQTQKAGNTDARLIHAPRNEDELAALKASLMQ